MNPTLMTITVFEQKAKWKYWQHALTLAPMWNGSNWYVCKLAYHSIQSWLIPQVSDYKLDMDIQI